MNRKELKEKYSSLRNESKSIARDMKPLFIRLKELSRKASKLKNNIDYKSSDDVFVYDELFKKKIESDWNGSIYFRLMDFDGIPDAIEEIDNVLHNIAVTPFEKRKNYSGGKSK